jgi:hypothetical protein
MKKAFLLLLLTSIPVAPASITLTNPITVNQGATQLENNTSSGVMTFRVNFGTEGSQASLLAQFNNGTVSGQVIARSQLTSPVDLTINLVTGEWSSTNGRSGKLGATQLSNIQTTMKNIRNNLEGFATNPANGIVDGTQVPW